MLDREGSRPHVGGRASSAPDGLPHDAWGLPTCLWNSNNNLPMVSHSVECVPQTVRCPCNWLKQSGLGCKRVELNACSEKTQAKTWYPRLLYPCYWNTIESHSADLRVLIRASSYPVVVKGELYSPVQALRRHRIVHNAIAMCPAIRKDQPHLELGKHHVAKRKV